jgi:large subunit ribosomal protein L7/L12
MSEINKIISQLSKLTIIEAVSLVKKLEDNWGVSVASTSSPSPSHNTQNVSSKKDYDIFLESFGKKKISIIKEVRVITGLSLIKAKEIVDSAPKLLKNSVPKKIAQDIKSKLESLGAKVILK